MKLILELKKIILLVWVSLLSIWFTYAKLPPTDPISPAPAAPPTKWPLPPKWASNGWWDCDYSQAGWFWNQNLCPAPWVPVVEEQVYTKPDFDSDTGWWWKQALTWVKLIINRVLWLLALIALIVLIYTGVMMLINARDSKKVEEWYGVVRNVAIALVFIWVSWLVVSFIFWAIGVFTGP